MDQVYENVEEILDQHRRLKREQNSSQDTSIHHEMNQILKPETTRSGVPGAKKSSCRDAAVLAAILLGVLCILLLIGLITLSCLFTQGKFQWEMEKVTLQKLYDNVTSERNQLQSSYNELATDRDRLQSSYSELATDRDQLQSNYNSIVEERDQLQKCLENLTKNRDELQDCQNWGLFNNSLYYVSSNEKTWQESRRDCHRRGADLMIINSQEEQNFAHQFKKYLWFGMTDSETEGSWKWVDGTPVNTSYWTKGEPNGGRKENCGQIKSYTSQNSWNDENCSILHFWICEKRISP